MINMKRIRSYLLIGLSAVIIFSCSLEYLDTAPSNAVSKGFIFESMKGAEVAINGIYRWMYQWNQLVDYERHDDFGYRTLGLKADLMGHDMKIYSYGYGWFIDDYNYTGRDQVNEISTASISYNLNYDIIYNANVILDEIDNVPGDQDQRDWIKAQALTVRAHAYLWLAQFHAPTYAGNESAPCVPLKVESSEQHMPVSTVGEVYARIVADLEEAMLLFESSGVERPAKSYVDLSTAQGLRARTALIMEDWNIAISNAQSARAGYSLMDNERITSGFNEVSDEEWIWGFDINDEHSTVYASFFSHMDPVRLSYASTGLQKQMPAYLFDTIPDTDIRKQWFVEPGDDQWFNDFSGGAVPTYVSVKFLADSWAADYLMMRAAEMYLIEAEAAAQSGQFTAAQIALNAILEARDPGSSTYSTGSSLVGEIRLQRRIELWGEGFGLFDIKRWKIALDRTDHDPTLCLVTDLPANSTEFNLRIPQYEIDANDELTEADQID